MADRYYVPGGTNTWSATANWSASATLTPTGASVPTVTDNVFFTSATTYTVNITASAVCLNFTASAGSPTITMTNTFQVAGNFDLTGSTITWTASTSGLFFQNGAGGNSTPRTVNSAGTLIDCPVTVADNVASTVRLVAAFTIGSSRTFTFSAGVAGDTFDLNGYTLTCGLFNSANAITRTLAFGTGNIVCLNTGSVWDTSTITGLTITGTPVINFTYSGATAMTVRTGALTAAMAPTLNFTAGTYSLSFGTSSVNNISFTGSSCSAILFAITVYGNLTLGSTMTIPLQGNIVTFASTSGIKTITTNGVLFGSNITFNGVAGTWQLQDNLTCPGNDGTQTSQIITLTNGTFDLNGKVVTGSQFNSVNSNIRTIAFGSTGYFALSTQWTTATVTNLTITGTPRVDMIHNGVTATSVLPGALSEANAISFNFTAGTYTLTFLGTASYSAKNVNFTGFAGTWAATSTATIYGGLTLSSGMTLTVSTSVMTFGGTTASTKIMSPAGKAIPIPMTFDSVGSTYQFTSGMSLGVSTTKAMIFLNGTFNINSQPITLGFAGSTWSMNTNTVNISNVATNTTMLFTITSGTCNLTNCNFGGAVTFTAGTLNLLSNTTIGGAFTYTAGTININDYTFTTFTFAATGATIRVIAFGASGTGNITCNGTGTVWTQATIGTFSYTGTPIINISNPTATAATVIPGIATEAQALNFNFTTGTYTLTFLATVSHAADNINFTGFSGIWAARTTANTIYGNLTLSTGLTFAASTGSITFGATSGTQNITFSGKTFSAPFIVNAPGAIVRVVDAAAFGSTQTLNNGTFDANGQTLVGTFTIATGSVILKGVTQTVNTINFTQSSGTVTLGSDCNTNVGTYTLTAGTLDLAGYKLTTNVFSSSNANVRTIAFGTGNITCVLSGTVWTTATTTNLTITGTPVVNISNVGVSATTVASGILTEAQAISFNFTTGTYTLTFLGTVNYSAKNVDFTGFAGTWNARSIASTIYGSLTLSTGMIFSGSSGILTLGATSGTQILTSNGRTMDTPLTINGAGGTVQLADALTMGSTRAITMTNGTFDGNSKTISSTLALIMITGSVVAKGIITTAAITHTSGTLTQGGTNSVGAYTLTAGSLNLSGYILTTTAFATGVGTKDLTFNGGTLTITNATTTAFNNVNPLNFTTTAGTGTGKISMTAATAKTFVGGGSTYNCTLSNDGAGTLTITGANTFTKVANGVQPTAFVFPSSTTTTVSDFGIDGTAGNLVTITSSTSGTAATLSSATSTIDTYYVSLKDSAATGGAVWTAYNSTNVSGNTGWIFSINSGNFFAMFF